MRYFAISTVGAELTKDQSAMGQVHRQYIPRRKEPPSGVMTALSKRVNGLLCVKREKRIRL